MNNRTVFAKAPHESTQTEHSVWSLSGLIFIVVMTLFIIFSPDRVSRQLFKRINRFFWKRCDKPNSRSQKRRSYQVNCCLWCCHGTSLLGSEGQESWTQPALLLPMHSLMSSVHCHCCLPLGLVPFILPSKMWLQRFLAWMTCKIWQQLCCRVNSPACSRWSISDVARATTCMNHPQKWLFTRHAEEMLGLNSIISKF